MLTRTVKKGVPRPTAAAPLSISPVSLYGFLRLRDKHRQVYDGRGLNPVACSDDQVVLPLAVNGRLVTPIRRIEAVDHQVAAGIRCKAAQVGRIGRREILDILDGRQDVPSLLQRVVRSIGATVDIQRRLRLAVEPVALARLEGSRCDVECLR